MKSIAKGLLVALLLPVFTYGQVFKAPEFSWHHDEALLGKQIMKHSPLMKLLTDLDKVKVTITPAEARALVREKLNEWNNEELNKLYQDVDEEGSVQIGVALYILMNGLSNTEDEPQQEYKSSFGAGAGVYLMWTLANIILMPELAFLVRPYKQEIGSYEYKERFSYLTLAFTAMYLVRLTAINLLFGLSPNIAYALGGKSKAGDNDWEDIDFDNGVKRSNFGLGIVAGIMLQNAMVIRLMYNLGLSKLYDNSDVKMYALMLSLYVPIWRK